MIKNNFFKRFIFISILIIFFGLGIMLKYNGLPSLTNIKETISILVNKNRTVRNLWKNDFELVHIKSSLDHKIQKAYFYKSRASEPVPLLISLHMWGGDYTEFDSLAILCKTRNINYIHPNFRGDNSTFEACCSQLALSDIDDAITYAIENSNVDLKSIFVIGASGGGYATLSTFMRSKHKISKFSAWAPISDLIAWHDESNSLGNESAQDILKCTNSINGKLNKVNAKKKSPIYWNTPKSKLTNSKLFIYAGVYDGLKGSVPITHSINFYNKVLSDLEVEDSTKYVSHKEKQFLLKQRKPLGNYTNMANRKIFLLKKFRNIKLIIYDGKHEFLEEYALEELLKK